MYWGFEEGVDVYWIYAAREVVLMLYSWLFANGRGGKFKTISGVEEAGGEAIDW